MPYFLNSVLTSLPAVKMAERNAASRFWRLSWGVVMLVGRLLSRRRSGAKSVFLVVAIVSALILVQIDSAGRGARAQAQGASGAGGAFVAATGRIYDTRASGNTALSPGVWRSVSVLGQDGVPTTGVSAVVMSITAINPTSDGWLNVIPGQTTPPSAPTTSLTWDAGFPQSNTVIAAPGSDGTVQVRANGAAGLDVVVDLQGYFTDDNGAIAPGGFVPITQTRVADTRNGTGVAQAKLASGGTLTVDTTAGSAVPAGTAAAVFVQITTVNPPTSGRYVPYATGTTAPSVPSINFTGGTSTTIGVTVPVDANGRLNIHLLDGGPTDVVVDVQGYYTTGTDGSLFNPTATRVYDSRTTGGKLAANETRTIQVSNLNGVPSVTTGIEAVAAEIHVIAADGTATTIRAWTSGQNEPTTTAVTSDDSNLSLIQPGPDNSIKLRNVGSSAVDIAVDIEGWFSDPGPAAPYITSDVYPENVWSDRSSSPAEFDFEVDSGTAAVSYQYSIDGGPTATATGATASATATVTSTGSHYLLVTATDRFGITSPQYEYDWYIGSPPTPPQNLTVTPMNNSLLLAWAAPSDHGGASIDDYDITVADTTVGTSVEEGTCDSNCRQAAITGLSPEDAYTITVTAESAAGGTDATSSSVSPIATGGTASCSASDCEGLTPESGEAGLGDDTSTVVPGTATSDADNTQTVAFDPTSTTYNDSVAGVAAGAVVDSTGTQQSDDCSLPVEQRSSAWACMDGSGPVGSVSPNTPGAAQGGGPDGETPAHTTGYCRHAGCWYRYSDFHGDFQSNEFSYGYGGHELGHGDLYVNWTLVGPKETLDPVRAYLSTSTTKVVASAAMMNGAEKTKGGRLVAGPVFRNWPGDHAQNVTYSWPKSRRAWFRDYHNWDHNTVVQYSWHIPNYSGVYWWVWVRSIVSHTTTRNTRTAIYRFDKVSWATQAPAAGGWRHE